MIKLKRPGWVVSNDRTMKSATHEDAMKNQSLAAKSIKKNDNKQSRNRKDSMKKVLKPGSLPLLFPFMETTAQVKHVEFGKNRVQYQKFKWNITRPKILIVTSSQEGLGLGKYVAQIAEDELPGIEICRVWFAAACQILLSITILMRCSNPISGGH